MEVTTRDRIYSTADLANVEKDLALMQELIDSSDKKDLIENVDNSVLESIGKEKFEEHVYDPFVLASLLGRSNKELFAELDKADKKSSGSNQNSSIKRAKNAPRVASLTPKDERELKKAKKDRDKEIEKQRKQQEKEEKKKVQLEKTTSDTNLKDKAKNAIRASSPVNVPQQTQSTTITSNPSNQASSVSPPSSPTAHHRQSETNSNYRHSMPPNMLAQKSSATSIVSDGRNNSSTSFLSDRNNSASPPMQRKVPLSVPANMEEWVFESVIQFLESPLWSVPIMTFIDKNCFAFLERNVDKYHRIHEDYQNLVDQLLIRHLERLEIGMEQFLVALKFAPSSLYSKSVVDQVVSIEDFLSFKKMMVARALELESEAFRLMEVKPIPKQIQKLNVTSPPPKSSPQTARQHAATTSTPTQQQTRPQQRASAYTESLTEEKIAKLLADDSTSNDKLPPTLQQQRNETSQQQKTQAAPITPAIPPPKPTDEELQLKMALEISMRDMEQTKLIIDKEQAELEHALALSLALEEEKKRSAKESDFDSLNSVVQRVIEEEAFQPKPLNVSFKANNDHNKQSSNMSEITTTTTTTTTTTKSNQETKTSPQKETNQVVRTESKDNTQSQNQLQRTPSKDNTNQLTRTPSKDNNFVQSTTSNNQLQRTPSNNTIQPNQSNNSIQRTPSNNAIQRTPSNNAIQKSPSNSANPSNTTQSNPSNQAQRTPSVDKFVPIQMQQQQSSPTKQQQQSNQQSNTSVGNTLTKSDSLSSIKSQEETTKQVSFGSTLTKTDSLSSIKSQDEEEQDSDNEEEEENEESNQEKQKQQNLGNRAVSHGHTLRNLKNKLANLEQEAISLKQHAPSLAQSVSVASDNFRKSHRLLAWQQQQLQQQISEAEKKEEQRQKMLQESQRRAGVVKNALQHFRSQVVQEQANNRLYQLKRYAKKHSEDEKPHSQSKTTTSNTNNNNANNTNTTTANNNEKENFNQTRDRSKSVSRALGRKVMHDLAQDSTTTIDTKSIDSDTQSVLDKLQQERNEELSQQQ